MFNNQIISKKEFMALFIFLLNAGMGKKGKLIEKIKKQRRQSNP
jgi:hypothetical protein